MEQEQHCGVMHSAVAGVVVGGQSFTRFWRRGNGRWGFWLGRMQRGQWSEEQAAGDEYPVE